MVHGVERLLDESLKGGMFYLVWRGQGERGGGYWRAPTDHYRCMPSCPAEGVLVMGSLLRVAFGFSWLEEVHSYQKGIVDWCRHGEADEEEDELEGVHNTDRRIVSRRSWVQQHRVDWWLEAKAVQVLFRDGNGYWRTLKTRRRSRSSNQSCWVTSFFNTATEPFSHPQRGGCIASHCYSHSRSHFPSPHGYEPVSCFAIQDSPDFGIND
jgi:hypothetical protein